MQKGISIHALLAESDYDTSSLMQCQAKFLSTLSLRRATDATLHCLRVMRISIHALLAESDPKRYPVILGRVISIHALLAESDGIIDIINNIIDDFYPRSPCGERLAVSAVLQLIPLISIHALLAESDSLRHSAPLRRIISIHALLAESDANSQTEQQERRISIHALLAESDR